MVDLGTGIAAQHLAVVTADLTYFLVGGVFLFLHLVHVDFLVGILCLFREYDVHLLGGAFAQVWSTGLLFLLAIELLLGYFGLWLFLLARRWLID